MTPLFSPGMPALRFRLGDSTLLRYTLVILISVLLHGGVWQYRQWLNLRPDLLPKPKPPIEVILTPAPPPVIVPPTPIPPAPVVEPVKPKPLPKAPPAPKPAPPVPKPVAPPAPPKLAPAPKPRLEAQKPKVEPPLPRPKLEPPPKPVRPTRRELEEDPNLPAIPKREPVIEKRIEPPPPKPEPKPVREAPPTRAPAPPPPRPSETRPHPDTHADASPPSRLSKADNHASVAASPAPRAPTVAGSSTASSRAPSRDAGGVTESAKANASYLHNPKPEYPALAKRRQWEGRVLLKVRVLANGSVAAVSVETSSGHELLDEAALEAVRQWHFVPAKRGGQAVDSWVNVPINFNLLDSQH